MTSFKNSLTPLVPVGLMALLGCIAACGASVQDGSSSGAITCGAGTRLFNGECRATCETSGCAGGTQCARIDDGAPICVEFTSCAFLDSDTQCLGMVYATGGRGYSASYESDPYNADPYDVTGYDDPYFDGATSYEDEYARKDGCKGNAKWKTLPAASGSGANCGVTHSVTRCRRIGYQCKLLAGTTQDFVAP